MNGNCITQRCFFLHSVSSCTFSAGGGGLEPPTSWSKARRSAIELPANVGLRALIRLHARLDELEAIAEWVVDVTAT